MSTSLKKLRPNRLSLEEIYQVYLLLNDGTPDPLFPTVMENITYMLKHISSHRISKSLRIFYRLEEDQKIEDHIDFLILFINAVRKNQYFDFVTYMRRFK